MREKNLIAAVHHHRPSVSNERTEAAHVAPLRELAPVLLVLKQQLKDKRIEHRCYIEKTGQDMPEIRNWQWPS